MNPTDLIEVQVRLREVAAHRETPDERDAGDALRVIEGLQAERNSARREAVESILPIVEQMVADGLRSARRVASDPMGIVLTRDPDVQCSRCNWPSRVKVQAGMRWLPYWCPWCEHWALVSLERFQRA